MNDTCSIDVSHNSKTLQIQIQGCKRIYLLNFKQILMWELFTLPCSLREGQKIHQHSNWSPIEIVTEIPLWFSSSNDLRPHEILFNQMKKALIITPATSEQRSPKTPWPIHDYFVHGQFNVSHNSKRHHNKILPKKNLIITSITPEQSSPKKPWMIHGYFVHGQLICQKHFNRKNLKKHGSNRISVLNSNRIFTSGSR